MPVFRYEVTDKAGQIRRGAMDAPSEDAVRTRLQQMGFVPRAIAAPGGQAPAAKAAPAAPRQTTAQALAAPRFVTSSLSIADQALFWRQLGELARSGIAPFEMFRSMSARSRNGRIRRACANIAQRVQAGSSVADAMAASGDVFGTEFRMAVLAGEMGGFAHEVYADFADTFEEERRHRLRWRWIGWFYKPQIALTIIAAHFVMFMTRWAGSLQHAGEVPDWRGYLAEGLRHWVHQAAFTSVPLVLFLFIGVPFILGWIEASPLRPAADRLAMSLPVLKQLKHARIMGRFYRMLRRLAAAGVAPVMAWDAAAEAVGNRKVTDHLMLGRSALMTGAGYGAALRASGIAADSDIQMMSTADQTGRVPEMLMSLEQDYDAKASMSSRIVRGSMIVLIMVAFLVVSVYVWFVLIKWWGDLIKEALSWAG